MKVQLIYPNVVQYPKDISGGIAILSALLKRAGYEVDLIDTTFGMKDSEIISKVRKFNPNLIALSSISANFFYATHVATIIKKKFTIPTIIGGVHPTVAPEETIIKDCFDMICVGEGDDAFLELVQAIKQGEKNTAIKNIWFKENGRIIRNSVRPLIDDLDSLPDSDLDIYDYPRYLKSHNMSAAFLGGRGCPYKCAYCINYFHQNLYRKLGPCVRYRNVNNIIAELKKTIKKYDIIKKVEFNDDTFTFNKLRVKEFGEKYKREVGLPFHVNARVDNISEEICKDLSNSGCCRVRIGVESGDEQIRGKVLRRNISDKKIIEGCRLIKKYGMELYTYNMIGIPTERMENIKKTIELNRKIRPDFLAVSIFTAYKGTKLYELCKENGWLDEEKAISSYYSSTNVKHPYFSFRKLNHIRKWFGFWVFVVYDLKKALMELIDRKLISFRSYSRFRTFLVTKIAKREEIVGKNNMRRRKHHILF